MWEPTVATIGVKLNKGQITKGFPSKTHHIKVICVANEATARNSMIERDVESKFPLIAPLIRKQKGRVKIQRHISIAVVNPILLE